MAKSVNKVILLGYIGKPPEVQYGKNGKAILKFSMATSESWKDKRGEWQEKTEWHNVVSFNASESLSEALEKGSRVYVEGKSSTSSWEDKRSGETKYRTDVIANQIIDLGVKASKKRENDEDERRTSRPRARRDEEEEGTIDDEDIPF